MADVSKLNADGVIYNIKDDVARRQIEKTRVDFQGILSNEYYNKGKVDDLLENKSNLVQSKNIFDFDTWVNLLQKSPQPISKNGTLDNIDFEEKSITFTSIANDTFTNNWQNNSIYKYTINVKPNTTYTLSWKQIGAIGLTYVFCNGISTSGRSAISTLGKITFTTKEDTSYITLRFGIQKTGSATISEIMLEEGDKKSFYLPYDVAEGVKELAKSTDKIKEDLDKLNSGGLVIKDNVIKDDINNWLNEHPEATTTVQDGTITEQKLETKLLSKLSYVTPQMYGAKADGINDDTEAMQRVIDSGKAVYIPSGTYLIKQIIIKNTVKIYGDGIGKTILKQNDVWNTKGYLLKIGTTDITVDKCVLSDFTILGGYTGTTSSYGGLNLYKTNNTIINNLEVQKCYGHGINVTSDALDCKFSNLSAMNNGIHGIHCYGYANEFVNIQGSQNGYSGILFSAGNNTLCNAKMWGNKQNGVLIRNASAILSNVQVQQNHKDGLRMEGDCKSCNITGLQVLANNYTPTSKYADEGLLDGCGITLSGRNNYIQGTVTTSYRYWNAIEKAALNIEEKDSLNNVVDLVVCENFDKSSSAYDLYFNDDEVKYNFKENKFFNQITENPLNKIVINGINQIDDNMVDISPNLAVGTADNITVSGTTLPVTLSEYGNYPIQTIADITKKSAVSGNYYVDTALVPLKISKKFFKSGLEVSDNATTLYVRITAKLSQFKIFGLIPMIQISYKTDSGEVFKYLYNEVSGVKNACIFGTDYVTKKFAIDISDIDINALSSLQFALKVIRLSDEITDTGTTQIDIKEYSYKFA